MIENEVVLVKKVENEQFGATSCPSRLLRLLLQQRVRVSKFVDDNYGDYDY